MTEKEKAKLLETLENTYWQLKELDPEDDENLEEMVNELVGTLDKYFA